MNNTFVSVEGVLRGRRGLNKVSENKKNFYFAASVTSKKLFARITKKTNSREAFYFQRIMDKNVLAILKEKRSTHILVVANLHFQIKWYSWHRYLFYCNLMAEIHICKYNKEKIKMPLGKLAKESQSSCKSRPPNVYYAIELHIILWEKD